jgi:DNA-binding NarL/FixJ family response regulator
MTEGASSSAKDDITVLVCDDSRPMRVLVRTILEKTPGLACAGEARDGVEAVTEARRLQPDVILLDLSMPVRTGLDALPDLRNAVPGAKVLVFTGLIGPLVEDAVLAAGADGFIGKHSSPDDIVEAILTAHTSIRA